MFACISSTSNLMISLEQFGINQQWSIFQRLKIVIGFCLVIVCECRQNSYMHVMEHSRIFRNVLIHVHSQCSRLNIIIIS